MLRFVLKLDRLRRSCSDLAGTFRRQVPASVVSCQDGAGYAPVAQGIEHRFPKPCAKVRILPGALPGALMYVQPKLKNLDRFASGIGHFGSRTLATAYS